MYISVEIIFKLSYNKYICRNFMSPRQNSQNLLEGKYILHKLADKFCIYSENTEVAVHKISAK